MLAMQVSNFDHTACVAKTTESKRETKAYLSLEDGGISPRLEKSWRKLQDNMSSVDSGFSDCSGESDSDRVSLWSERDSLYSEKSSDRKSTDMHSKMIKPQQTNQNASVCRPKTNKKSELSSRSILREYGLRSEKLSQSRCSNKENLTDSSSINGLSSHGSQRNTAIDNGADMAPHMDNKQVIDVDSMFKSAKSSQLYFPKRKQKSRVLRAANLYQF